MTASLAAMALLLPSLGRAAGSLPETQEGDHLYIEEAPEELLRKWEEAEEKKSWKERIDLHLLAQDRFRNRLCRAEKESDRWIRLPRVLSARLASMPDAIRAPFEKAARDAINSTRDTHALRRALEKYAFTHEGLAAAEAMAGRDFDEGRIDPAIRAWTRSMEVRPSPDLVARLATALAAAGDGAALGALRARDWKGRIVVAGKERDLGGYLAGLKVKAMDRRDAPRRASGEITLGTYVFSPDDGGAYGRGKPVSIPALLRTGGYDVVVVTNGVRTIALDPAQASGGPMEKAVLWRYPERGKIRALYTPGPSPLIGAALSRQRAFVTMFSRYSRRYDFQVGRRDTDSFDGPSTIRALDLLTGEERWKADSSTLGSLPFAQKNFCFAGPPVLRGDRLYAAVMTSPVGGQGCHVTCLNAADGKPHWGTTVVTAPASKRSKAVPTFAEAGGALYVQSNLGVVAALDAESGAIEWLVKYEVDKNLKGRPANPPLLHGSLVIFLPQDRERPLVLNRWTGREESLPPAAGKIDWIKIAHLSGTDGGVLAVTGLQSHVLNLAEGTAHQLRVVDEERQPILAGRGAIHGSRLYLPAGPTLRVYDLATRKLVASREWAAPGRLLVDDDLLISLSGTLELATNRAALASRFAGKDDPDSCRRRGSILEASGLLDEAAACYKKAIAALEKDPAEKEQAEELRQRLADLLARQLEEAPDGR